MKKFILALAIVLMPSFAFAATDDQIQASLVQQLLSIFVVQVNGLDKMQALVAQSSNPAQFNTFSGLLAQQLSETTNQLATLLNGAQSQVPVGIGAPSLPATPQIAQDCTPSLSAKVIKIDGKIETGVDFAFTGTSTVPMGCPVPNSDIVLQTPTTRYTGALSDWERNGHIKRIESGYVFTQGWGSGEGIIPSGMFTWTVGSVLATSSITNY